MRRTANRVFSRRRLSSLKLPSSSATVPWSRSKTKTCANGTGIPRVSFTEPAMAKTVPAGSCATASDGSLSMTVASRNAERTQYTRIHSSLRRGYFRKLVRVPERTSVKKNAAHQPSRGPRQQSYPRSASGADTWRMLVDQHTDRIGGGGRDDHSPTRWPRECIGNLRAENDGGHR